MSPLWTLLGLLPWCLTFWVKSLQLLWRSGTRIFHPRVPDLQVSCRHLARWQGTRIVSSEMAVVRHTLFDEHDAGISTHILLRKPIKQRKPQVRHCLEIRRSTKIVITNTWIYTYKHPRARTHTHAQWMLHLLQKGPWLNYWISKRYCNRIMTANAWSHSLYSS